MQPVHGARALHLPEAGALVVGDLHVGLESDLSRAGFHIPSQTRRMRERLEALLARTGARRLIVIGDLKHMVPYSTRQEAVELPGFFRGLDASVELVLGNHDVDLGGLVDVEVHAAEGIVVGDVGLTHGHVWPSEAVMGARVVVSCHNHPAVLLMDPLGHRHKEACWVRARFLPEARKRYPGMREGAEFVIMPAFNELTGGTAFNGDEGQRLLGPILGNGLVALEEARLYTVDGLDLGTLRQLRAAGDASPEARRGRRAKARGRGGAGRGAP